jgi:hypothetical protein
MEEEGTLYFLVKQYGSSKRFRSYRNRDIIGNISVGKGSIMGFQVVSERNPCEKKYL